MVVVPGTMGMLFMLSSLSCPVSTNIPRCLFFVVAPFMRGGIDHGNEIGYIVTDPLGCDPYALPGTDSRT